MPEPAESSDDAAPKRVIGRPFQPGQSGNPGGKKKGLARAVRDAVPAEDLIRWYRAIFTLDIAELAILGVDIDAVTLTERNKAGEWLADRGYGKAPIHSPVEGADPLERDVVDTEIVGLVDELAARREAPAPSEAPAREVAPGGTSGAEAAGG